ncbi:MAG: M20/M25/M40 family metallo-hydrolase [Defluviitaleaceae bacterium]|nr:M20/M25/M40 family metallo-hydrolase [Defluviitaleaceae bacterium]
METLKLIERLSNAFGAPGFEDDVVALASSYAKNFADLSENCMRNLYIRPRPEKVKRGRPSKTGKPVVMLDAHSDEVGFAVHGILPNGMLRIMPLGSWVPYTLPSGVVVVRNSEGALLRGVIASVPPHFMPEGERGNAPEISSMMVDIGSSSAAETRNEFKVSPGAPVVPEAAFRYNAMTGLMMGKAFDDRLGCACVLETLKQLTLESLDVELVGTLTAQEEVGLRGAAVAANTIKPDIAIFFEGTPADDYFLPEHMVQTSLKKGPMLRHLDDSMITNPRFQRFALNIAEEKEMPVQAGVRKGGSTNAGAVHTWGDGVPCIVIGIPVRYVHTHNAVASLEDYKACVDLASEIIRRLNADVIRRF